MFVVINAEKELGQFKPTHDKKLFPNLNRRKPTHKKKIKKRKPTQSNKTNRKPFRSYLEVP